MFTCKHCWEQRTEFEFETVSILLVFLLGVMDIRRFFLLVFVHVCAVIAVDGFVCMALTLSAVYDILTYNIVCIQQCI